MSHLLRPRIARAFAFFFSLSAIVLAASCGTASGDLAVDQAGDDDGLDTEDPEGKGDFASAKIAAKYPTGMYRRQDAVTGQFAVLTLNADKTYHRETVNGGDKLVEDGAYTFTVSGSTRYIRFLKPGTKTLLDRYAFKLDNATLTLRKVNTKPWFEMVESTGPQPIDSIHTAMGVPVDSDPADDFLMDKGVYVMSYNRNRNDPNWVSWNLNSSYLGDIDRLDDFRPDDALPADFYHVGPKDYSGSGYSQGHMCPSSDRTLSEEDNSLTFLMTNMLPQNQSMNAGPWQQLERNARKLVVKMNKELYIMAGPIIGSSEATIGKGVAVPESMFKIVVVLERGQLANAVTPSTQIISVIMPNDRSCVGKKMEAFVVTLAEIESRSGYDFLNAVPKRLQNQVQGKDSAAESTAGHGNYDAQLAFQTLMEMDTVQQ